MFIHTIHAHVTLVTVGEVYHSCTAHVHDSHMCATLEAPPIQTTHNINYDKPTQIYLLNHIASPIYIDLTQISPIPHCFPALLPSAAAGSISFADQRTYLSQKDLLLDDMHAY